MSEKEFYNNIKIKNEWSFLNLSRNETGDATHSYHKYPAKFIPQLARSLIENYTNQNEVIWDPFCGSGTLNVEAYRTKRDNIGTDINPIAVIISRAKTTSIPPSYLNSNIERLLTKINSVSIKDEKYYEMNNVFNGKIGVLKKWFSDDSLVELGHILSIIKNANCKRYMKEFALCAFSSILKRSSYWLNSSVKAQIEPNKNPSKPIFYFEHQLYTMQKGNDKFYFENKDNQTRVYIYKHNAKQQLKIQNGVVDHIITSPPYLVSYDYSDIFRLSTYFFHYQKDYQKFRKSFIGTSLFKNSRQVHVIPHIIKKTIDSIQDSSIRRMIYEYYKDMRLFFKNVKNNMSKCGNLIIVVGDTELRGVKIPNAYFLYEIADSMGWSLSESSERTVPIKILPTIRDKKTGRFTNRNNKDFSKIYNKEYILVFRKKNI